MLKTLQSINENIKNNKDDFFNSNEYQKETILYNIFKEFDKTFFKLDLDIYSKEEIFQSEEILESFFKDILYKINLKNIRQNKETLIELIRTIMYIARYEYRRGETIISDELFDGQQQYEELLYFKENNEINTKKSFLDILFNLDQEKSKEFTSPTSDKSFMIKKTTLTTIKKEIEKALKDNKELIVAEKIDGLSLYLKYNNLGKLIYAEQRGDGVNSIPIPLEEIKKIKGIKENININNFNLNSEDILEIQGEVVLETENLEKLNQKRKKNKEKEFKNPRSATSGCINKLKYFEYLTFKAFLLYKINKDNLKKYNFNIMFNFFKDNNIEQPNLFKIKTIDEFLKIYNLYDKNDIIHIDLKEIQDLVINYNGNGKVKTENDGLVISSDKGTFIGAKFSPKTDLLEIKRSEYTVGKDGRISIIIHFYPKEIKGKLLTKTKLDNVNSFNLNSYLNLFKPGDKVLVGFMGTVIPKVIYNEKHKYLNIEVIKEIKQIFFKLKTISNSFYIDKINKILNLTLEEDLTSENAPYFLKFKTIIPEIYIDLYNKGLTKNKLFKETIKETIKQLLNDEHLKKDFKFSQTEINKEINKIEKYFSNDNKILEKGFDFENGCPVCGQGLSGIGTKTVSCNNPNCEGKKIAELEGFIKKLSTNLTRKPLMNISELITYLNNSNIDTTSEKFKKIIKDNGTKPLSNKLLKEICNKNEKLYNELSNICFEKGMFSRKTIEKLFEKGNLNNFEDFFKLNTNSFKLPETKLEEIKLQLKIPNTNLSKQEILAKYLKSMTIKLIEQKMKEFHNSIKYKNKLFLDIEEQKTLTFFEEKRYPFDGLEKVVNNFIKTLNPNSNDLIIQNTYIMNFNNINKYFDNLKQQMYKNRNNLYVNYLEISELILENFNLEIPLKEQGFIEGFSNISINNVLHQINTIKKGNSDIDFIAALNIPNIATSTSTTIFQKFSLKELLNLDLNNNNIYKDTLAKLIKINGIGDITANSFLIYLKENKNMIINLIENFDLNYTKKLDISNLKEINIILTGSINPGTIILPDGKKISWNNRTDCKKNLNNVVINNKNGDFLLKVKTGSVNKKTNYVISESDSDKGEKCKSFGGKALNSKDFINEIEDITTKENYTKITDKDIIIY